MYKCVKCGETTKPKEKKLTIKVYRDTRYPARGEDGRSGYGKEIEKELPVCIACHIKHVTSESVPVMSEQN